MADEQRHSAEYVAPPRPPEEGWCTVREDAQHCECWWECEGPCCGCGFDGGGEDCDCPKHGGALIDGEADRG